MYFSCSPWYNGLVKRGGVTTGTQKEKYYHTAWEKGGRIMNANTHRLRLDSIMEILGPIDTRSIGVLSVQGLLAVQELIELANEVVAESEYRQTG